MAKLEIPSIVVQSGSHTPPVMDRSASRSQWSLSTQSTYEEECEPVVPPSTEEPDQTQPVEKEEDTKPDVTSTTPTNNNILPRSRSKANLKLLKRSHAIKESTSPPPDISLSPVSSPAIPTSAEPPAPPVSNNNNNCTLNNNSSSLTARPSIKRESSNQSIDSNWSSTLSRGNSIEQQHTDQSGVDIEQFLIDTMNKNTKDRLSLLRIETDLVTLLEDISKSYHKFSPRSSYQRMLVHRAAQYFRMEHNVDTTGTMVLVTKVKTSRLPDHKFVDFIRDDMPLSEEPRRSILKRDSASFEDTVSFKGGDQESQDEEDLRWPIVPGTPAWPSSDSSDSTKLHPNSHRPSRLTKVESYESKDTLRANSLRSSVSKSFSFGGYDQNGSNNRVLTKQDSGSSVSSRVSPSSSGYKSQSQRSDTTMSATPSPTATPHLNTQTGQPYQNEDGSVYHFDPNHPPRIECNTSEGHHRVHRYQNGVDAASSRGVNHRNRPETPSSTMIEQQPQQAQLAVPPSIPPAEPSVYQDVHQGTNGSMAHPRQISLPQHQPSYHPIPPSLPPTMAIPPQSQMNSAPQHYPPVLYQNPNPYGLMQPPSSEPAFSVPSTNPQPIVYSLPPANPQYAPVAPVQQSYDRIPVVEGGSQDLCGYLMGLSMSEVNREAAHRSLFYCPSVPAPTHAATHPTHATGHFPQAAGAQMPMYFAPPTTQPQAPAQPTRYQCSFAQYPATERPSADCNYPQPPVQSYFSRCPAASQVTGAPNYCTANGTGNSMIGLVQLPPAPLQQAQPSRPYHRMLTPPPPNTSQNGPHYPMYSNGYGTMPGCYPHFQTANPPSQLSLPPLLRPTLQLGVCNSPPLRGAARAPSYNNASRSPVVREPGPSDSQSHMSSPLRYSAGTPACHPSIPMYRFSYPNEVILLNPSRAPYNPQGNGNRGTVSSAAMRRQRPRPVGPPTVNGRPILGLGAASQQQAALSNAIEAAGLGVQTGERMKAVTWLWSC